MAAKKRIQAKVKAAKKPMKRLAAKARATVRKAKVQPIPAGYPRLISVAVTPRCGEAIAFYKSVFGAKERMRMPLPDGSVAHAELTFGDAVLMLADPMPGFPATPTRLSLYTKDCDATYAAAVKAGAKSEQEPTNQFYGDRQARITDPFGNQWSLMTHVEDVSPREMKKRMASMSGPQ